MSTTSKHPSRDTTDDDRVDAAACRLYDAEWALHVARQSQVDAWIAVAYQTLHIAVAKHLAAIADSRRQANYSTTRDRRQANPLSTWRRKRTRQTGTFNSPTDADPWKPPKTCAAAHLMAALPEGATARIPSCVAKHASRLARN